MSPGAEPVCPSPGEDWSVLMDAIQRFEDAWKQGPRPSIDDHLPAQSGLRQRLLIELAHIDLELRLKAGEAARVEEYLSRYPELSRDRTAALDLIAAEHEQRRRREPELALDEYLRRFPQYHGELQGQLTRRTIAAKDSPPHRASQRPEAPPEIAGYQILSPLGKGGMGVVYKARQLSLDRPVALKVLPLECAQDPVWLARFRGEALTASSLNHPNICTIYDTRERAGRPFLSMELIEGRTLATVAAQHLGVEEVCRLVAQAARALAAAHAAGVVHRDIKPANLMVRDDGIVKVLDFGLARRLRTATDQSAARGNTDPGTLVGTVLYMSPEQARAEPVGPASDIFSLGLVLYELATGQHPFLPDSEEGVLNAIMTQAPLPPARLNPQIPAPLDALIQHMLSKDARLRPAAVEVAEALAELSDTSTCLPRGALTGPARCPTVGRRQELAELHAGFESAAAGRGMMLCVTGEPGLGKTTLVETFLHDLAADGRTWRLARGHCSERLAGAEAYLPFLEALDSLLQGDGGPAAAQVMKLLAPSWYMQLVPLATDETAAARSPLEARDASQERRKREFGLFVQELSRRHPLVIFLDDVHWADPSSIDLLAYLGSKCAALRVLLILTYRPSDLRRCQHPFKPVKLELQGRGVCREIELRFLTRDDLESYVDQAFAGHQFPAEFPAVLHGRTEGNPLFMVDLLRYLRERGVIVQDHGRWALVRAMPDLQRELPESVRGIIQRKTDQLCEADRQLLMAASVQGRDFDSAVVAHILERDPADVEERLQVLDRVYALVRLVREQVSPNGTLTLRYSFVHVLYQNALYAMLLPTRKATWSGVAARALQKHYGETCPTVAAQLALLFEAARQPAKAIEYFLLAARNAVEVFAHREAVGLARRGLALLATQPDTPARSQQELPFLLALGVSLVATKGFASPEVEQTYLWAREVCQRIQDKATLFPVLYGLWNVYLLRCELLQCKDLATQMFALAEDQPDSVLRLQAHNVMQQPLLHMGEFADARRHQQQCQALYNAEQHATLTAVYGEDPGVGCMLYGAVTLWCMGYPEQALRSVREARRLAEQLSHPFNVARALYFGAFMHVCRREAKLAGHLAGILMDLCREQGFALLVPGGLLLHGWSLVEQGQAKEGIDQMRQGLTGWRATGALSHRPYQLALLAEALAREGQAPDGLIALDEALALAEVSGERFLEAELHRLRGELLLVGARDEPATQGAVEACFRRALDVARRQSARSLELRAMMSLSRLYRQQRRGHEIHPLLSQVHGWFTEGFDTPDLRESQALLAELA
jgi:predicted ATPase